MVQTPPLICTGPAGCGKSVVCRYLLELVRYYPVVDFKCFGFTSTQQLIIALWGKVKSTLLHENFHQPNHQFHSTNRKFHALESDMKSISCPTNFKGFVICLRSIIDIYYSKDEEAETASKVGLSGVGAQSTALCIFLDGIDHLASLSGEPSICAKFLTLSTVVCLQMLSYPIVEVNINPYFSNK